jgi:histidyl-tRNA synthetase
MEYKVVKGTRDFLPLQMQKRNYIFNTIIDVYKRHGFLPIETPALENLSTLMGKYGEEGDKLLFKVLNSGDFTSLATTGNNPNGNDVLCDCVKNNDYKKMTTMICEKGLRYDLTVPFARFVVNHLNDISFPFKRYQIQPVWRADRPQKGRYREFYQCDADIIGSDSLMNEVELLEIIDEVFSCLKLNVSIKLNNRKILASIAEVIGKQDKIVDITVAIDKLDKIGMDKVLEELKEKDFSEDDISKIKPILMIKGTNEEKLSQLKTVLQGSNIGEKGLEELSYVLDKAKKAEIKNIDFDITLARGLNYYTGAILEVKAKDVEMGSITGGGRYDNLTGIFGVKDLSGVGISFGEDRIYDCLEELNLFPQDISTTTTLLFVNFGEKENETCLSLAKQLRKNNVSCEIYPDSAKIKKQMKYANDKKIPFVALIGEKEIEERKAVIKNMTTGEQKTFTLDCKEWNFDF